MPCCMVCCWMLIACGTEPAGAEPASGPARVSSEHLPNAYRLHERVLSGGLPDGEAAFRELQELGVKTIISVDGARPEVALARKYGLRYVHLPHGYDGISAERQLELAKAVRDLPGPIYIHCHHGKHRSPAAATVACVELGLLRPDQAEQVLKTAGTSEHYRGLYRAALEAKRVSPELLDRVPGNFPETAKLPPMAEAMVAVEHHHDRLKQLEKSNWSPVPSATTRSPAEEALLLREALTELLRTPEVAQRSAEFQTLLRESESATMDLERALRNSDLPLARSAWKRVDERCVGCHRHFRDQ